MVENIQATKPNSLNIILLVISIVISIAFVIFIGKPLFVKEQALAKENKEQAVYINNLEKKLSSLVALKDKKPELEEKNNKVLAAIPDFEDVGRLFIQFERIARENGIDIQRTYSEGSATATGAQQITPVNDYVSEVVFSTTGGVRDYPSLKIALSKLQEALRMLQITKIDIRGGENNKLDTTITVKTYVRR